MTLKSDRDIPFKEKGKLELVHLTDNPELFDRELMLEVSEVNTIVAWWVYDKPADRLRSWENFRKEGEIDFPRKSPLAMRSIKKLGFRSTDDIFHNVEIDTVLAEDLKDTYNNDLRRLLGKDIVVMLAEFQKLGGSYNMYIQVERIPKVGNFCTHYNILSEITRVDVLPEGGYCLGLKTFYKEGIMTHSSSIFQLIECNVGGLIKTLKERKDA